MRGSEVSEAALSDAAVSEAAFGEAACRIDSASTPPKSKGAGFPGPGPAPTAGRFRTPELTAGFGASLNFLQQLHLWKVVADECLLLLE